MLPRVETDTPFRVVGIDPGTENLGFSVLDLFLHDGRIQVSNSSTLYTPKMMKEYRTELLTHGDRTARLMALEDSIFVLLEHYQPNAVCAESPFLSRFPQAFAALTECVSYVRRAVNRFDRYMPLHMVDPPTAKKAVGVHVKRGVTKDDVTEAVRKLDLVWADGIVLDNLDEHQVDSIAVAYYQTVQFKNQIPTS